MPEAIQNAVEEAAERLVSRQSPGAWSTKPSYIIFENYII